jgi:TFIIF-interacting CTD phosphatase-like protein
MRVFIKDLRIIENRTVDRLIIVDNLAHCFGFQIPNGIPILEWRGEPQDVELVHLSKYLANLVKEDQIVMKNSETFKLEVLYDECLHIFVPNV